MLGTIAPVYSVHYIDLGHSVRVIDLVNTDSIDPKVFQTQHLDKNNGIIDHRQQIGKLLVLEL